MAVSLLQRHFLHVKWLLNSNGPLLRRFLRLSTMRMKYNRTTVCDGSFDIAYPDLLGKLFIATFFSLCAFAAYWVPGTTVHVSPPGAVTIPTVCQNMCPPCMCENLPGRCLSFAFCGSPACAERNHTRSPRCHFWDLGRKKFPNSNSLGLLTLKADGRRQVPGCRPGRCLGGVLGGVSVVSRWCLDCLQLVSLVGVSVVSWWCFGCL